MNSDIPTEVELMYEVMPCNSLRTSQEPVNQPHACTYFRKWGTYHSYDYIKDGPPADKSIQQPSEYKGRAFLLPEVLSGCRKAPILALGINPNLPAFWDAKRNSIYPNFDDYKQYAHYFRYRSVAKLEIPQKKYVEFGGDKNDTPFTNVDLAVPANSKGQDVIPTELQNQEMYVAYQGLLNDLALNMKWKNHALSVGEDLSYGNMVACASAKWITKADPGFPTMPPMTIAEKNGIVSECFFKRKYFIRQLLQSLPRIIMIFSQTTSNAFISTFKKSFVEGKPLVNEPIEKLLERKIVLKLGVLPDQTTATARIIFAPHITGDPLQFKALRGKIISQLADEAGQKHIELNPQTGHLKRTSGSCTLCPVMQIGKCDYENEIATLVDKEKLYPRLSFNLLQKDKAHQHQMLQDFDKLDFVSSDWNEADNFKVKEIR